MRIVDVHMLDDKMDEAVTHYINSHQHETVHIDTNGMSLNIQDEEGRMVTVSHSQFPQMCRQISEHVGDGPWNEELLDTDGKLAALVAHLTQHSRAYHQIPTHHKQVNTIRDVDSTVMLESPIRMYNGQTMEHESESMVSVPMTPLPSLQEMKRGSSASDWFHHKDKGSIKETSPIITEASSTALEVNPGSSAAQIRHQSKKSLPHKKRISKKLKRNGGSTPQQDIVVLNCNEDVPQEEILPDSFVAAQVHHEQHINQDAHHITHEVRPILICQLCGDFYGEDQLKFYQHLKQHYEPHATIIIENPVNDLGIDKMSTSCIVDNVSQLPDSIVELSLGDALPKTSMYQQVDKQILYQDKQYNKYSVEQNKHLEVNKELYDESLERVEWFSCTKCDKSFRKQKLCEMHIKEVHGVKEVQVQVQAKLEQVNEFSEDEDLMEVIQVTVEEQLLPHLTVDNGHVTQENRFTRPMCQLCDSHTHIAHPDHQHTHQMKDEMLQRMLSEVESPVPTAVCSISEDIQKSVNIEDKTKIKEQNNTNNNKKKSFVCGHCPRVFSHKNSLNYHTLSHLGHRQHPCSDCDKAFYTAGALKVHKRVHNGDRPCKCNFCGKLFRQWGDLRYHTISLHSDVKNFKCDFCGKEFARKYSLNVHRRIHTGEKNYKCDICNMSFRASSYRLTHMKTHTGDRPHKCAICDKAFRSAGDLRRHLSTHVDKKDTTKEAKKKTKKPALIKKIKDEITEPIDKPIDTQTPIEETKDSDQLPILYKMLQNKKAKKPDNSLLGKRIIMPNNMKIEIDLKEEIQKTPKYLTYEEKNKFKPYENDRDSYRKEVDKFSKGDTDKMPIYTQIVREVSPNSHLDIRNSLDVRETNENVFIDRLTELYNIPAV